MQSPSCSSIHSNKPVELASLAWQDHCPWTAYSLRLLALASAILVAAEWLPRMVASLSRAPLGGMLLAGGLGLLAGGLAVGIQTHRRLTRPKFPSDEHRTDPHFGLSLAPDGTCWRYQPKGPPQPVPVIFAWRNQTQVRLVLDLPDGSAEHWRFYRRRLDFAQWCALCRWVGWLERGVVKKPDSSRQNL